MPTRLSSNAYQCKVITGIIIISCIIYFRHQSWIFDETNRITPSHIVLDTTDLSVQSLQSFVEFQPVAKSRIPMIIHQAWKNENIDQNRAKWIKTWIDNHPKWTYIFWTDSSARRMLADKYPELLYVFDSYPKDERHACVLKYVLLFEYGGVFVGLDVENHKSIDTLTQKYACVIPQSPFKKKLLGKDSMNINAILACRAKHPLLRQIIEKMTPFVPNDNATSDFTTQNTVLRYKNYIQRSRLNATHTDSFYMAPDEFLQDVPDSIQPKNLSESCFNFTTLPRLQQRKCEALLRKALKVKSESFLFSTSHRSERKPISTDNTINIFEISPRIKFYKSKFN